MFETPSNTEFYIMLKKSSKVHRHIKILVNIEQNNFNRKHLLRVCESGLQCKLNTVIKIITSFKKSYL